MILPTGTTAQRPTTVATGQMRYNTSTNNMELHNGNNWIVIGEPQTQADPNPWEQWYAWYPVRVHGKRKWLTKVWRRVRMIREDTTLYADYEYGNIFDVIKEE